MRVRHLAAAAALAVALLPRPVVGQTGPNLLVNGGFDSGLAGYTVFASPGYIVAATTGCPLGVTCALFGTPGTGPGVASLSQTAATLPGASYLASITTGTKAPGAPFVFFLEAGEQRTTFDCLVLTPCVVTRAFTATGPSTVVRFGVEDFTPAGADRFGQSGIVVDNASLVLVASAVVPEPGTWALLATGLAAVAGVATRRRRRAASRRARSTAER
ncbi:PEP-CTERM sorting domain-containing protein [Roseisolibacter agri]|uniref:Ice-binding protein C-terminal domain-containing protein n=1 Tax=Roseisolibacter agri TaxID=2014610 RepID=A0AA37Q839_9BACT|nr:PEP-CTERM sorting domain-containing protein [Roseisolibacter agri]GLC24751.1 hypothetical protein rosag_12640 [Roseisolibacter agri]